MCSGAGGGIGFLVGVLTELLKRGRRFDYVVGVSSGALTGIMYAVGKTEVLYNELLTIRDRDIVRKRPLRFGVSTLFGGHMGYYSNKPLRKLLRKHLINAKTKVDFTCVSVNAKTGEEVWWQIPRDTEFTPEVVDSFVSMVISSTAIPVAFSPEKIGDHYYSDGGSSTHTPIRPTRELVPEAQHMTIISSALQERNETGKSVISLAGGMLGDLISSIAEKDFSDFEYKNQLALLGDPRYKYIPADIYRPKQELAPTTRFHHKFTIPDIEHGKSIVK